MPCPPLSANESYLLFPEANVRVTKSLPPNDSRSESVVVCNPKNDQNLICASKKFFDPVNYHSKISTSFTFDGGKSWTESEPPLDDTWDGMTDPDLTFDAAGNAYLIVEPLTYDRTGIHTIGIYVYSSGDGGRTWNAPVKLHHGVDDDKMCIEADTSWASPHAGAVYAAWAANTPLRFARSFDQGATWQGAGGSPPGTNVSPDFCFAPSIAIGNDGTVHITWHVDGSSEIQYTRSTDGGFSFSPVTTIVTGVHSLRNSLRVLDAWPQFFPNGTFRVITLVASCMGPGNRLIVAWADFRELVSRIYYSIGSNGGTAWLGPPNGQPLLSVPTDPAQQHFHPQLAVTEAQAVGCAYYDFGPKKEQKFLIDVHVTFSCDDGDTFHAPSTITDQPWDPAVNPPFSRGDPAVTFIGEYFGFCAVRNALGVVWTDTRTGYQELFYDHVGLRGVAPSYARISPGVLDTLAAVVQDGGGLVYAGGKLVRIPPSDPWLDVLHALVAIDAVKNIRDPAAQRALAALQHVVASVAKHELESGAESHQEKSSP